MSSRHASLLVPGASALIVVDVQERFRPLMPGFECMALSCGRLVRVFRRLDLPVLVTEQYPKGLGSTVAEVKDALLEGAAGATPIPEKTSFSSYGCKGLPEELRR